jgi:Holliday junction resolvase
MRQQSKDDPIPVQDRNASVRLAEETDSWIDLARVNSDGEWLMHHLSARYEDALATFLPAAQSDPNALQAVLQMLSRQLARAQADIFVLKSAVLGRDRMVLTRDWDYQDPLRNYRTLLGEDAGAAALSALGRYVLPLDDSILGFGWHPTERRNESVWRWSGPGLQSGLTLPRFFDGRVRIEIVFNQIKRDALAPAGAIRVDGAEVTYVVNFAENATGGKIIFDVELKGEKTPFFLLEFETTRTYSAHRELGTSDKREVGICIRQMAISRRPIEAAEHAER